MKKAYLMSYERPSNASWQRGDGEFCIGCELPAPVNDLGLCEPCQAKVERDLVRARAWDHTSLALGVDMAEREALRLQIMREYGKEYELLTPPTHTQGKAGKGRSSRKSTAITALPASTQRPTGAYGEQDVVDRLAQILASSPHETWHELSETAQLLRRTFPDLNPKLFGYKKLRHLVQAHPQRFQTQWDNPKQKRNATLYIRLTGEAT
jgi:hypothetical protein